ncbi:hypothetical protein BO94DRAFT_467021 [Aspergillus sclerotioniger CBS 115572]|uniref:Uncharacterized protein n=1 Tax=Aspergillus sclerotioniger CBS 115572 TaxID=1450535 RepID=A0A317WJR7_9EURO|nr:hypothetical protein BO94DRAFT_467021 [Aspergillus sclerotioniger CBS 115572]PWY86603.1 hypothetical protein BO94DRAFT_467021 [Aspergillus sclerotioniger CBS 115572]
MSAPQPSTPLDQATLRGLMLLSEKVERPSGQAWEDAIHYSRAVIISPQDTVRRATSVWARSCSDLHKTLLGRFGPAVIEAARVGCQTVLSTHYNGDGSGVAHVDKRASFKRHWQDLQLGSAFYPPSSPLAVGCYESGTMVCSLVLSAWMPAEAAVKFASLSHLSVCDDFGSFTSKDAEVRVRMVALAIGAAYEGNEKVVHSILDGTALQAVGTADTLTVAAAMAWRAVGGCATVYSGYVFANDSIEQGLVAPEVMMAVHDLLDWRSDTAAGNHENAISAVCGMGVADPFHTFVEALLERALFKSLSGAYGVGATTLMHFTAARYAAYEYRGTHGPPCLNCIQRLREVTLGAGLKWSPTPPPSSFEEGHRIRQLGQRWVDYYEDHGLVQEGLGWFQYLVETGKIGLFDVIEKGVVPVDMTAGWV